MAKDKKAKKTDENLQEETITEEELTKDNVPEEETQTLSEVEQLKEEVQSYKDQLLRNQAELQNFKRRINEERIKDRKYANLEIAKNLLPALDNFALALDKEKDSKELKPLLKGFEMIYRDLFETLKNEGLEEIQSTNQPFDPNKHQAVMKEPKDGVASNIVIEEFQKGYMFKDRLLRPAMVKVSE